MIRRRLSKSTTGCVPAAVGAYMHLPQNEVDEAAERLGYKPNVCGCDPQALLQLLAAKNQLVNTARGIVDLPCLAQVASIEGPEVADHLIILSLNKKGDIDVIDPSPIPYYSNMAVVINRLRRTFYFTEALIAESCKVSACQNYREASVHGAGEKEKEKNPAIIAGELE